MANGRLSRKKQHPEVVTGDFELHFEEVVNRNRYTLVALLTSGILIMALVVPGAVYYSTADTNIISIEAEKGIIINKDNVLQSSDDNTASDNSYIEFKIPPTQ